MDGLSTDSHGESRRDLAAAVGKTERRRIAPSPTDGGRDDALEKRRTSHSRRFSKTRSRTTTTEGKRNARARDDERNLTEPAPHRRPTTIHQLLHVSSGTGTSYGGGGQPWRCGRLQLVQSGGRITRGGKKAAGRRRRRRRGNASPASVCVRDVSRCRAGFPPLSPAGARVVVAADSARAGR